MSKSSGKSVFAEAAVRGVHMSVQRAGEIAADVCRINAAAAEARHLLDFNDEPARFVALLAALAPTARRR